MFTEERHKQILSYLNTNHRASVTELSQYLEVSESTVRRDLNDLEKEGKLRRTHGGAIAMDQVRFEPPYLEKQASFLEEKKNIAEKALQLIRSGETVLLDAGTTTLQLAKQFYALSLTVVTNSVDVLNELQHSQQVELHSTGGMIRAETGAMVGPYAEEFLRKIKVDKVFLGMNAVDLDEGLSTPNALEAQMKREMIQAGKEVILLCDHSKLGKVTLNKVASLTELDLIITDRKAPAAFIDGCQALGVEVMTV